MMVKVHQAHLPLHRKKGRYSMLKWLVGFGLVVLLVTGCQKPVSPETAAPPTSNTQTEEAESPATEEKSVEVTPIPNSDGEAPEANATTKGASKANADSKPASGKTSDKPDKAEQPDDKFDPAHPKLLGIALGDKKDTVVKKLGKPVEQFTMEDEKDPVTVFEYDGYAVGFNKSMQVLFVEVSSSDTATGLSGLKVGDKDKDALKALGKADSNTNYVLSYKADAVLLKLDIDPQTHVIQSIKLFADK